MRDEAGEEKAYRVSGNLDMAEVVYGSAIMSPFTNKFSATRFTLKNGKEHDVDMPFREFEEWLAMYRIEEQRLNNVLEKIAANN